MGSQDKNQQQVEISKLSSQTRIPELPINTVQGETQVAPKTTSTNNNKTTLMWLIVASPEALRGTVLPISSGSIIGRQGGIRWQDVRMSRFHAKFSMIDNPENPYKQLFCITPQKDRNGTIVNGKRISEPTPLNENDVIIMGDTEFVVKVLS